MFLRMVSLLEKGGLHLSGSALLLAIMSVIKEKPVHEDSRKSYLKLYFKCINMEVMLETF